MITLNLIPESIRKENTLRHVFKLNVNFGLIVIYTVLVVASLVQIGVFVLNDNLKTINKQSLLIDKNTQSYNQRAREINDKIKTVDQIVSSDCDCNAVIGRLVSLLPGGVKLSYLKIDRETGKAKLSGLAEKRDDLLSLKDNIDSSGFLGEIKLPVNSILEKENIRFNIESELDLSKIK